MDEFAELNAQAEKVMERFLRLVPDDSDMLAVVLKSHLLIEERLNDIIEQAVADAEPLRGLRLTFENKSRLAQALAPVEGAPNLWRSIAALNSVRNRLSHEAEPTDLDRKLAAFFDAANGHPDKPLTLEMREKRDSSISALRSRCAFIYVQLWTILAVLIDRASDNRLMPWRKGANRREQFQIFMPPMQSQSNSDKS